MVESCIFALLLVSVGKDSAHDHFGFAIQYHVYSSINFNLYEFSQEFWYAIWPKIGHAGSQKE